MERSPAGRAACLIMLRSGIEVAHRVRIVALSHDMCFELVTRNRQYRTPVAGELQTGALTALKEPDFSENNDNGVSRSHSNYNDIFSDSRFF